MVVCCTGSAPTMMDTRCLPPRPMMAARSPDTLADFTVLRQPPVLFPAARARSQMMTPAQNDTASDRAIKRLRTLARRLNITLNLLRGRETGESLKRARGNLASALTTAVPRPLRRDVHGKSRVYRRSRAVVRAQDAPCRFRLNEGGHSV